MSISTSISFYFSFSDFISCALVLVHSFMNSFKTTTLDIISNDNFQKAFRSTNVLIILYTVLTMFAIFTLTSEIKEFLALKRLYSLNNDESASDISMSNINSANTNKHVEDFSVPIDPGEIASIVLEPEPELESTSDLEISDNEVHEEGLSHSLHSTNVPFECCLKWDLTTEELKGLSYSEKARRFYILTNQGEFVKDNEDSHALEPQTQKDSVVALSEQANETETSKISRELSPINELAVVPFKPMNYLHDLKIQCDEFDVHKIEFIIMKKNSKLAMSFLQKLDKFQLKLTSIKSQDEFAAIEPHNKSLLLKSRAETKVESEIEIETKSIKSLVSDSTILNTTANTRQHDMLAKIAAHLSKQQLKCLLDFITQFIALSNDDQFKSNTKAKFKHNKFKLGNLLKSPCHHTLHRKCNVMASMNRNLIRPKH